MLRLNTLGALRIEGRPDDATEMRARHLALLAILAAAGAKGISREQLLAILWSERDLDRARHSLSQALYALRRSLGVDVIRITPNLTLDRELITSDVGDFEAALADKNWKRAAELFVGPFLDGFYLTDAPDFERWVEERRSALTHDAVRAIETAAREAAAAGHLDEAASLWRQLARIDPVNARFALSYIEALSAVGSHEAARQHAESHAELVRRELEAEPDSAIVAFLESARRSRALTAPRVPTAPAARALSKSPRGRRLTAWIGLAAFVLAGVAATIWRSGRTPIGRSTAGSVLADRLYEEGRRAFYRSDAAAASRLFAEALNADSSFAMAAYFAWRAELASNGRALEALADRAVSLASNGPERDRLLINTHIASSRWELRAIPMAESLATRFPNDVEALIAAARVEHDLRRATVLLDRAITLDSVAMRNASGLVACTACDAFAVLAERNEMADSVSAIETALNRWSAFRPDDYEPWRARADFMTALGRADDAARALQRADSLGAPRGDSTERRLVEALRFDDYDRATGMCHDALTTRDPDAFTRFRWLCTIALRSQGRYLEALRLVRSGQAPGSTLSRSNVPPDQISAAILDMEMGRPLAAAFSYSRLTSHSAFADGHEARSLAWHQTLAAIALTSARDTVRVRALADSVEMAGQRSLDIRDSRLHHFVRGLLLAAAREHAQAVREFREAGASLPRGFTRINYEMAKSLMALHRPGEAVTAIRSALRSRLNESSAHVTRSELHELMAQAFDMNGQPDSAAHHYAIVERAWRSADPAFSARYDAARARVSRSSRLQPR